MAELPLNDERAYEGRHEMPSGRPLSVLLQEVLLQTDGTVTNLLELFTGEEIYVEKVTAGLYSSECEWPKVELEPDPIVRDVLLCGKSTGLRYIFAHTHLFPEALAPPIQRRLSETSDPIGKVLREFRLESFRQIEERGCRPMPVVAQMLGRASSDRMQWRRYSVISGGTTVMEITEVFSERLFVS